jgi:ribosomal protein L11 methyltransferase
VLELTLRVGADDLEAVLDAILPRLPGGVHIREDGGEAELAIAGGTTAPDAEELRALAGPGLIGLTAAEVSDDWRQRRLDRYRPLIVAERFLVRPDWAPAGAGPDLIEIEIGQSAAFGTAMHPTTQACLALLAESGPGGSLADYGCGTGVLSIAAAKLGWSPIVAVDVSEPSLAATAANAERNRVEIEVRAVDLTAERPPLAETVVANVPPAVHLALTERLVETPGRVIASGFRPEDEGAVAAAWGAHGLELEDEVRANDWSVLVMG